MTFKWDWDKKELVEGKQDEKTFAVTFGILLAGAFLFIEVVCPVLGRVLFGAFL